MIRSSSVLRDVSAAAAAALLALLVGLSAAVPAQAEDGEPAPVLCIINCDPGNQKPGPTDTSTPSPTQTSAAP
ncbi:hypothetical protein AHiyo4_15260 [Arthrobacter sp. Hiyo4]|nr:hypothetical protein AHiyo4_15260 [Arthrobacter sp. Hiyo4]